MLTLLLASVWAGNFGSKASKDVVAVVRKSKVNLKGKVTLEGSFAKQDETRGEQHARRPHIGFPEAKVSLEAKVGDADKLNGGYVLRLNPAHLSEGILADRHYLYLNSKVGTWRVGNDMGPHHYMCRLAQNNMNTLWLRGSLDKHFNSAPGYYNGAYSVGHSGIGTKLAWYSPDLNGFQVALAYTPNTAHSGLTVREDNNPHRLWGNLLRNDNPNAWTGDTQPYGTHNVNVAASYKVNLGACKLGLAGSYMFDKSRISHGGTTHDVNNVNSYMVAASLGFGQLTLAGEYLNNGKSRLPEDNSFAGVLTLGGADEGNAGKAFNTSLRWQLADDASVALGYQRSWRELSDDAAATRSVYTVAYKRGLGKNFDWYTEVSYLNTKLSDTAGNESNKGLFVGTGLSVKF